MMSFGYRNLNVDVASNALDMAHGCQTKLPELYEAMKILYQRIHDLDRRKRFLSQGAIEGQDFSIEPVVIHDPRVKAIYDACTR